MIRTFAKFAAAAALATGLASATAAQAQTFTHAVRIVVPYAPGGSSDILARLIAPKLQEAIGQAVVVENKPGGSGNIGADAVAKAAKDGHTYLLCDVGTLALAPSLFTDLTFDPVKDLAPVDMIMFAPYVLAINPIVPAKTVAELIAYAKANPGKLAVANSGIGGMNHVTPIRIAKALGIEWKNVPYRGGAAASRAVISGESQVIFNGTSGTLQFVKSNQLVGLAISGPQRLASVPDLPTFDQAKLPAGDAGSWQGLLATAGSPPALIAKIDAELRKILADPTIITRINDLGGAVKAEGPEAFRTWMAANVKLLGEVVRENGIKGE